MSVPPPEILGLILMILGGVTSLAGKVMIATEAFEVSSGWGWATLLAPFGELIFIFKYWKRARDPFLASLIGGLIIVAGAWVSYGPSLTIPPALASMALSMHGHIKGENLPQQVGALAPSAHHAEYGRN